MRHALTVCIFVLCSLLLSSEVSAAISVVQCSSPVPIAGEQSRDVSLTGVVAGDSLLALINADSSSDSAITFTATSYVSTNALAHVNQGSHKWLAVLYRHNVASGSHTVSIVQPNATFFVFGSYVLCEVSGLKNQNALAIPSNTAQGFGNAPSITTGTAPAASMLILTQLIMGMAVNPMNLVTPSGDTSILLAQNNSGGSPLSMSYRIISTAAAQSRTFGTTAGSENYGIAVSGFEAAPAASALPEYYYRRRRH